MHLSCDCLNILINSKNINFTELESKVTDTFTNDPFFQEKIALLSLCSINIQVPSLVAERESGLWRIVTCLNCNKSAYAFNKTMGFGSILARRDLEVDTNKINRLKQSEMYSPIFKILIYQSDISSDDEGGENDQKTAHLYPAATSWLNEQAALAEERVKMFSEKEYAALDELRKRAYKEQKVINRREEQCAKAITVKDPVEDLSKQLQKSSLLENKRKRLVSRSSAENTSIDSEGVFLLDGVDNAEGSQSVEDSDSDESDEFAAYSRRIGATAPIAKSLPIPVPMFMEEKHHDPEGSPQVPEDIAASIKALARSVHGDTIFGELPPPRFSTNL